MEHASHDSIGLEKTKFHSVNDWLKGIGQKNGSIEKGAEND